MDPNDWIPRRLQSKLPMLPSFAAAMAFYFVVALMLAAFVVTYAYVPEPEHRPRWSAAFSGGLVATLAWTATCVTFAYLLPRVRGVILGACWAAAADA